MEQPTPPGSQKVSYQISRDVLVRIWWLRMMFRPRRIIFTAVILLFSLVCFFVWPGMQPVGFVFLGFIIVMPIAQYRVLSKAVDGDRTLADAKTLEFNSSQLVLTKLEKRNAVDEVHELFGGC